MKTTNKQGQGDGGVWERVTLQSRLWGHNERKSQELGSGGEEKLVVTLSRIFNQPVGENGMESGRKGRERRTYYLHTLGRGERGGGQLFTFIRKRREQNIKRKKAEVWRERGTHER